MGLGASKLAKRRAESLPVSKALDLIEKLNLTQKEYAEIFCCVSERTFSRWKSKGRIPANRFWASQNALKDYYFREYQEKMEVINGE